MITSGGIDKLEAYRRLEIPEVWFWENNNFSAYHLRTEGTKIFYEKINQSECLPQLDFALLTECVEIPNQIQAIRKFRQLIGGNNQT